MGNYIVKNDETIFRCNNWGMDVVYEYLLLGIKKRNLTNDRSIMDFVSRLDQDTYGRGAIYVDVAKYLPPFKDTLILLIEDVVNMLESESKWHPDLIESLKNFKKKLTEINK